MCEQPKDERTLAELAQRALDVQNACNLIAVINGLHRDINRLWTLLGPMNRSTLSVHPIMTMWMCKIQSMENMSEQSVGDRFRAAMDDVEMMANTKTEQGS
jgi:hypothetical protein